MATLNNNDYKWCVEWIRSKPVHKDTLKASGLSRTQIYAGLQAIETYMVNAYNATPSTTIKATIEGATSGTPTLAQNKVMWYAWASWKAEQA